MHKQDLSKIQVKTWFILLAFATLVPQIFSTGIDTYWHIKVGEWIINHQTVPTQAIFIYTHPNTPWVSHEWLSSLLIYLIFHYSGWPGLLLCTLSCLLITVFLLLDFLFKRLNAIHSRILLLLSILLLVQHVLPRPHILALPLLVYWTAKLIDASERQGPPPFYILPLMIVWVNLHGSFLVGIAFSIFFAFEAIFYAPENRKKNLTYQWLKFISIGLLFTLITPHGFKGWLLPFQVTNMKIAMSFIAEWQPPNFQKIQPLEFWLMFCMGTALLRGFKLPVFRLIFLLGILHLSLKHLRYVADLLSVLSPLVLATPIAKQINSQQEIKLVDIFPKNIKDNILIATYLIGLTLYLFEFKKIEPEYNLTIHSILTTLKTEQDKLGPVLNEYGLGGYLIYHEYPVFIDGRAEIYGDEFLKEYINYIKLSTKSSALQVMLEKYRIQWTIFSKKTNINFYFDMHPDWNLQYSDKNFTIYTYKSVQLSESTQHKLEQLKQKPK